MRKKILFHIGYHKTGTTFLQRNVFCLPEFNLISRKDTQKQLLALDPYRFNVDGFEDWLSEKCISDKLNVISDEELSGNIHTGGNGRSVTYETINRLSSIKRFDVYILVLIREQVSIIDSCYRQYVKKGGTYTFYKYYYAEKTGCLRHRFPGFYLDHFRYDDVIEHLYSAIGESNVLLEPYEAVKDDLANKILARLYSNGLLDKKLTLSKNANETPRVNESFSNVSLKLARITNRISSNDPVNRQNIVNMAILNPILNKIYNIFDRLLFKRFSKKYCFNQDMVNEIRDYFREPNKRLMKLVKKDLSQFGYRD